MKSSRALIIIVLLSVAMFSPLVPQIAQRAFSSSESPAVEWSKTYGTTRIPPATTSTFDSVIQTRDGGYAVVSTTDFGTGNEADQRFWLVKTDTTGNAEWSKTYGEQREVAASIVQTTDGGFALVGNSVIGGYGIAWLVKTDSSGNMQWNKSYTEIGMQATAFSMIQTNDGGYVIAGCKEFYDGWLMKTDANGTMQWSRSFVEANNTELLSVVQTNDGGYIAAGATQGSPRAVNAYVVKTDAEGNSTWSAEFCRTADGYARSIVQTNDGGYAIVGETTIGGNADFWLIKTDSSGNLIWDKTYGGTGWDGANSVVQTSEGGYALAGQTNSFGAGGNDLWAVKADAEGNTQWNQTYGEAGDDGTGAVGSSVVQTCDGGYALCGYTNSFSGDGSYEVWLIKLAGSGPRTWIVDDDGPADFHTIQEAINAASDEDTVFVRNGTYYENVVANKTLLLLGEDAESTIIDGGGVGNVVNVTVDGVNVTGFTVQNGSILGNSSGIYLDHASNCSITGNNIADNWAGIWFEPSSNNNSVSGNNITNNEYGIYLYSSSNNTIFHNNFVNNNAQVYSSASPLYRSLVAYVPKAEASLSSGTLAAAMNTIITANSWQPSSDDNNVPHYATVFSVGSPSYYQTAAQIALGNSDPRQALYVLASKRAAELDGLTSAVSDSTVQSYLSGAAMVGYIPKDYGGGYFLIYDRFEAGAYRWASPSLQSKWNAAGALTQINSIVQVGMPNSPGTYIAYSQSGGYQTYYRYYDDTAETLEWFLEVGGNSYMSTCDQIWDFQQNQFWNGQYYGYSSKSIMETEVGPFALVSGRYLVTKGTLSTYGDRVVSDLNQKLLINGYSSPLWNHYSLNHVPGYDERRLENAAAAWAAMQAYYPLMTSTMQGTLQGMGSVGWRGLLDESGDFNASSNMFSIQSTSSPSMGATGVGLMVMFMNGIVPKTGSLAVPLNDERYEDTTGWSPATMFRFDYANRQIRIPVNAGTLNFIFGSGTASYTFPSTGVYQVQFSSDWNTVQSASCIASLDSNFKYISGTSPPPTTTGTISISATYNGNPVAAQVQVTGPTSTTVTTPTTITVEAGDYSLLGTYQTYSLTRTCTVPANGQATVSFPFTSSRSANTWDEGYPSGGNYWSDYNWTDFYNGPYQNMTGSDGMGDTPYTIDANNQDHYPLMKPFPWDQHDIGIASLSVPKTVVVQGYTANVSIMMFNYGQDTEIFNVTAYVNETIPIETVSLELTGRTPATVSFTWSTTGFAKGNYSISAYAEPVPGETSTADNHFTGGWVAISMVGDLTGGTPNVWDFVPDGKCSGVDISVVARCFGSWPGCVSPIIWNANCDINNNGHVDGNDVATVARHFGEKDP